MTPLMALVRAVGEGRISRNEFVCIKEMLLGAGADPGIRDDEGRTAAGVLEEVLGRRTRNVWVWEPVFDGLRVEEGV
ncbi:hypothetical protein F4778DRAFT_734610 [Xylariomycetidae sp. FL2044]|nr:hypothetical protein F4778DRAFT_734610 [Xylariomycetidae sp. FL2044]